MPAGRTTARPPRATRLAIIVSAAAALAVGHAGCGSDDAKERFTRALDAGREADAVDERLPEVDETLGGPCTEDAECEDAVPCTFDRCDKALLRCRNTPDDAQCADPLYCNGRERCVLRLGCAPGPVVTCQDDDPCTIDRCVEATKTCEHAPRDVDGDGDPDNHCVGKRDCNDLDPDVSSQRSEVCGNFKDDNCNGVVDEPGCVTPKNDDCASLALPTSLRISTAGTYMLSTAAAKRDFPTTLCPSTVLTPLASRDVVVPITVPPGPSQDIEVWATAQAPANEVSIELRATCLDPASKVGCGHVRGSPSARAIARDVAPGAASTVYAVITTQQEGAVDLSVVMHAPTGKPPNESCATASVPVPLDTPFTVTLIDPDKDVPSACDAAETGELTYSFTLPGPAPADVQIFASTIKGTGQPVVSLRDAACSDELRCRVGAVPPLFARGLSPGSHIFTVSGTRQIDATVLVKATYPATTPPHDQSCATADPIAPSNINRSFTVDLSKHEDAIKTGCLPGGPSAAYELTLTEPSDVLVIGRFATNDMGSVALSGPGCTTADLIVPCATGSTPERVSKRNLPAGSYRVVVADQLGQTAQLTVLVRPAVPPVDPGLSDKCVSPFALPGAGGFFTGDTTTSAADFSAGCDAPGQPIGGAKDQILELALGQKRRVILDMLGSFYPTILDVRQGAACPGVEVPGACYVGFDASRSILDLTLDPGTYWVQIDGYNGESGPWNLDVRVLAP